MKKAKFNISGMHCNACATLIENNLNDKPGVIKTKVSHDSKKAVVIFDETKISETEIAAIICGAGDYEAELIKDVNNTENKDTPLVAAQPNKQPPAKSLTSSGLIVLMVASLIMNFYFFIKISSALNLKQGSAAIQNAVLPNAQPSTTQAPAAQPSPQIPTIQSFNITQQDHIRGNFNAPVTLVEFSDFQCPYCSRHEPTINKIINDYPNQIRFVYKHFPLPIHQYGQKAAEASECASEQEKFWEYHNKLFASQTDFNIDNFKKWAADLGLNTSQFNSCLDSGKYTNKVQADFQEGSQKGVTGTPATYVNGNLIVGAQPYDVFKQAIDEIITKK